MIRLPAACAVVIALLFVGESVGQAPERKAIAERFFQPLIAHGWAQGLVVGVVDERGVEIFGYGRSGPDRPAPPDGETLFEIGSITKLFTGTLLADMAQRGEVAIDDPVNKYLPSDIPTLPRGDREMRLVDLATHSSGLPRMPSNWKPADMLDPYADYSTELLFECLRKHAEPSLTKSIGKALGGGGDVKWEYSNLGVSVLGQALSRRAERPYEELVLDRICKPLGLDQTRFRLDADATSKLIGGHDADGTPMKNWQFGAMAPAGALRSNARDLLRFLAANVGLIDTPLAEAFRAAREPRYTLNPKVRLGLNWFLADPELAFHSGMTGGYNCLAACIPSKKIGVVALADTAVGGNSELLDRCTLRFLRAISDDPQTSAPHVRSVERVAPETLERYVGTYSLVPLLAVFTITREEDRLYAQLTGQPKIRIYPETETDFFYRVVEAQITFETNQEGQVERLVLHQNGADRPAPRN